MPQNTDAEEEAARVLQEFAYKNDKTTLKKYSTQRLRESVKALRETADQLWEAQASHYRDVADRIQRVIDERRSQ